jgi:hypothetical protein
MKNPHWLIDFSYNVYSQAGEDGIIIKILEILPENDRWCVEFGAADGTFYSNTRNLIINEGYSAILIEADKGLFKKLQKNYLGNPNVITINQFVGWSDKDNLDQILSSTPIPEDFDLLSIDIDGNDYHVWKAIRKYKPKIVVIEFNPTIPPGIRFVQQPNPSTNQGASLSSLVDLGKEKGYELVAVTGSNAFFVKSEYFSLFQIEDNRPEILWTNYPDTTTYLFVGYDGTIFLHGCKKLPWHEVELKESSFQVLPKFLRKYPGKYGILEKIAFSIYLLLTNPRSLISNPPYFLYPLSNPRDFLRKAIQRLIQYLKPNQK